MEPKHHLKNALIDILCLLLLLLFAYTATSKFLNYHQFVFQMLLAPVPFMKPLSSFLGWIIPTIEITIAIIIIIGMFYPVIKLKGLYAAVCLLTAFEIYIGMMLVSGSDLPCTCGGIISDMGWKQHLAFNAFFILSGILSIKYLRKFTSAPQTRRDNDSKILARA